MKFRTKNNKENQWKQKIIFESQKIFIFEKMNKMDITIVTLTKKKTRRHKLAI